MCESDLAPLELAPGRWIGGGHPTFVVAEVGQNHQGSEDVARSLILAAKQAGADCVKFQKSSLPHKFTQSALERPYGGPHSWGETYGQHKAFLEFTKEQYSRLKDYAEGLGLCFTASAMDIESADFLESLGVPFIKVGSGDANNPLLFEHVGRLRHRNLVISTGMSDLDQVKAIYRTMAELRGGTAANSAHSPSNALNFVLMQCTSAYPTAPQDANLRVISAYRRLFPNVHIGYSGHEQGFVPTLGAIALGARVIERHITLDKTWKGSDHACSLDADEFRAMVAAVRTMEQALGSPDKRFLDSERSCYAKLGKSVVAAKDLSEGTILQTGDLAIKVSHPAGVDGSALHRLLGSRLLVAVRADCGLTEAMTERRGQDSQARGDTHSHDSGSLK